MPCVSDYMEATGREEALSRVLLLLDELDGKGTPDSNGSGWRGYDDRAYGRADQSRLDSATERLCERLKKRGGAADLSLEMQVWWRDHQRADRARVAREKADAKRAREVEQAMQKLTARERNLLGVK